MLKEMDDTPIKFNRKNEINIDVVGTNVCKYEKTAAKMR